MLHFIKNPLSNKINKSKTCHDKPHASDPLNHPSSHRKTERGNVFFTLFGAVAVVGILGAGIMQTMQGPLNTMVQVNLRERAKSEMSIQSKLALLEATNQANSGDCDSDGFVEPLGHSGAIAGLTGGGSLPTGTKTDPWGNEYGYCAWDAGDTSGTCGGAYSTLLDGDAPTEANNYSVIAIISAGPDGIFQTTCQDHPTLETRGGDDLVENYTYETAVAGSGGLWNIKSGTPTSAEINKDVDLRTESDVFGSTRSPQLILGASSIVLPTDTTAGMTCNSANQNILRVNTATDPDSLELCLLVAPSTYGWRSVAAGATASALADDDTTVTTDDSAPSIVFAVNGTDELTITPSKLEAGSLDIETTGTLNAGAATFGGNTAVTGTFDVNGATTLDALTASGNTTINGAFEATSGATISGGSDPSLSVTGNIGAVDVDLSGDLNLGSTESVNWGDASVNITGDATADSLVFAANTANFDAATTTFDGAVSIANTVTPTADPALDVTGNVDVSGDLDVDGSLNLGGDQLSLGTLTENNAGRILIGQYNGTDATTAYFSSETVGGDASLGKDGVLTIINGAIDEPKMDISNGPTGGDCLKYLSGVLTWQACSGGGGGDGVGTDGLPDVLANDNSANSLKITDLADPTANQDAATKKYVDDSLGSLASDRIQDLDNNTFIEVDTTDDGLTDSIVFTTNGTTRLTFDKVGNADYNGGAGAFYFSRNSGANTAPIVIQNAFGGGAGITFGNGGNVWAQVLGLPTDDLVFNTDVTERARFTAAGDLLIGTNTAAGSAILQMDSTSKGILIPRMTLAERNAIGTPANGLVVFATDAGDAGLLQFYDGTQWVDVGGGGANTGGLWTDLGGDRIHYGDAGTEQVGIGTDNPVTTLDVNGGIRVGSVSGADAPTYLSLASLSDTDVSSASDGQYLTYNTGSGNWEAQSLTGAAVPDGSLDWDKFVDAMTLDTTTTIDMDTNSANLNFDSDTFVIDSADDRIGIGTSSPAHELHVIGNIAIPRGNTYGVNHLGTYTDLISLDSANNRVYGSLGSNTRSRMLILNNGQMNLQTNAQDIIFSSKALNTESARITGNGNILVGTTTEDTSALLNLNSTTSGFLTPRMNNTQRDAIASPATSLLIFSVTDNEYQYNAGTPASPNWVPMSGSACADPTPDAFDFSNLANQTISSVVASNIVQITGVSCAVTVSSSGDASTQLQSCSDATCSTVIQGWSSSVQINNGEYVQARLTTSSTPGATSTTTITIGSASDSWSVSTSGGDCSVANPIPGTVCADGTVYAGKTVDGNVKMYVTRCDEGMSWNGSVCTGTRVYPKWATNGNTSDDSGGGGTVSGFTNTYTLNALVNTNSPFPMADRCATLTANGHSDWYLPATQEYVTILGNKDAIGYFNNTATYFASNQSNVVSALAIRASDQTSIAGAKINTSEVRCARKDGALPPAGTPGGTDGHVQYNEGGNLNGNANFVWDYTNNNLGIGTDTPAAALDVTGNTGEATIIARATDISVPFFQAYGDLDGNPNAPFMNISVVNSTSDRIVVDFEQERAWLQSPEFRFNYLGSDSNSGSQFLFTGNAAGSRLIASDRAQSMVQVSGGFEQTGTAAMDAFIINPSIYTTGDGTTGSGNNLLRVANTGVDQFVIDTDGKVGIGTNAPDASASLDIASTSRGFLTPRMTTTERDAIATPATGLMVYNTTSNTFDYYDGAAWASFASSAGTANALSDTGDGNTSIDVDTDNADTNNTTVFTNAGTQSMIIDATGDVGIGTMADPSEVLHVARTGQDPTIRIQNDGSANSTAIAITDTIANRNSTIRWTTGGNSERAKISAYMGSSGASPNMSLSTGFNTQKTSLALKSPVIDTQNIAAASISYTTDLPTSGNDTGLLISKTDTASNGISLLINAQTDSTTQFSVDDSGIGYFAGNVGIGNASPDVALDVTGDIEYTGTLTDVSDRRLKDNITPLNKHGALIDRINQIETVSFVMKDDAKKRTEFGVIAQQLETIFPELVHTAKDEMGTKSVNYVGLIAPMIEATKELKAENDALKAEIATMKSGQDEIMASLASMQDDMNGLKLHTGFGIEKANLQTLAIMLLMMILGGSCVMIATRIRRHS